MIDNIEDPRVLAELAKRRLKTKREESGTGFERLDGGTSTNDAAGSTETH